MSDYYFPLRSSEPLERYKREANERREAEERERQARKAREAEAKQRAASTGWENWWAAVDQRIAQWRDLFVEATGDALGEVREELREEFKVAIEKTKRSFEAQLAEHKARLLAVPGKLPVSKIWRPESVSYQAEFVCHDGSLWQACKDTAQAPGGSDWVCVARAGRDGLTPNICGTFNAHETYARFDVVECDGASFIAIRDNPGVPGITGDGWQLMSRPGGRGLAGEIGPRGRKGERGARGEATPTIILWTIDRKRYRAIPTMSDGKVGVPLELRELFEQFCDEAIGAAVDAAVTTALKDATRTNPGLLAPL
jgi:hypothetical protein